MKRVFALIITGLFLTGCAGGGLPEGLVKAVFDASDEAFANPMKGFRPARYLNAADFPAGEYVSTVHHLIKYTDLESSAGDTARKIIDWSDEVWAGLPERNVKVIPRIIIANPGIGEFWPEGLGDGGEIGRWTSEAFKERVAAFIAKLGEAWDDDPRVAAVEAGIWGYWGEHHIWTETFAADYPGASDRIPADIQKVMGGAFAGAFKNKQVMVRYPNEFQSYHFGYYWDSFAYPADDTGDLIIQRDTWREVMNSGEVAYEYADSQNIVGGSPDGTLSSAPFTDHIIDWVERTHTSSLGWIANYTQNNPALSENAARLQKAMGYRFVVQSAVYNKTVDQDCRLSLEFDVANTGSAPFYYQWPVEVSLLDGQRAPVWKAAMSADIRGWLPGGVYTVRGEFVIPENLPKGTYVLVLAVLDPAGNQPSLRFANKNYYTGGRMPLGTIGIGREPETDSLGAFDSLYSDRTLRYGSGE